MFGRLGAGREGAAEGGRAVIRSLVVRGSGLRAVRTGEWWAASGVAKARASVDADLGQAVDRGVVPRDQLQAHGPLPEELEWRFNNRENPWIFRDQLHWIMQTDPLEYRTPVDG